jgi:flavodoxin
MKVTILVGTMTGTAQLCAQEIELALDDGETEVETLMMDNLDASVFSRPSVFLVCTSTYGQGDVPDNARALYEDLKQARPDLSQVRYGVFGLGDRTYAETFNFGGKRRRHPHRARRPAHRRCHMHDARAICRRRRRWGGASNGCESEGSADGLTNRARPRIFLRHAFAVYRQCSVDRRRCSRPLRCNRALFYIRPERAARSDHERGDEGERARACDRRRA